ncbi:MAG TPA: glycosyltransferase [Verrucomicrobiae bacterium]|jgi:glycosyltransferase involved in cell wall biosynthesis|nr:glycosyltransferase [Verrucomicrobiae bacterium]
MRHLHFTQSLEPLQGGGLGTSTVALHGRFLAAGIDSRLCSTYGQAPQMTSEGILEFRRSKPGVLYYSSELSNRVRGLAAETDILHGHGLYVGTNYLFGREARRQGKPLVYHVHGFFEPWILNRSRWKKKLAHWLFEDANFRCVKLWRALTPREAEQIRACGITAPIVVAPNGLNLENFPAPAKKDAPIETPFVPRLAKAGRRALFLGRIHPKKGLDLLLSSWAALNGAGDGWELVIAGPDENGYLDEIKATARALNLLDRIQFTGPVTGQTKIALLHSADLFVLPSYSEGFSMSLLEAMACKVPVVATQSCNFPDVTVRQAGWECDCTRESVYGTLNEALREDDSARQQRGLNGYRLVAERYAWPAIVSTILEACSACCQ